MLGVFSTTASWVSAGEGGALEGCRVDPVPPEPAGRSPPRRAQACVALAAPGSAGLALAHRLSTPLPCLASRRIHPTDRGHSYVAQLVVRFLQRALAREAAAQALAAGWSAAPGGDALLGLLLGRHPGQASAAQQQQLEQQGEQQLEQQGEQQEQQLNDQQQQQGQQGQQQGRQQDDPRLHAPWATPDASQLPPPMLRGAEALPAEACLSNERLKAAVVPGSMAGFGWEDQGQPGRPEIRAVAHAAGAKLTVKIDTGGWVGAGCEAGDGSAWGSAKARRLLGCAAPAPLLPLPPAC